MFKSWGDRSIRTKLLLGFAFAAGVTFLLIGGVGYFIMRQEFIDQTQVSLATLIEAKAGHLDEYVERLQARTEDFASDGFIREQLKEGGANGDIFHEGQEELQRHLTENKRVLDEEIIDIHVGNLDGKIVSSTSEEWLGKQIPITNNEALSWLVTDQIVFVQEVSEQDGSQGEQVVLSMTTVLRDTISQEPIGVLMNTFSTGSLTEIIERNAVSFNGGTLAQNWQSMSVFMVDETGRFLTTLKGVSERPLEHQVDLDFIKECQLGFHARTYENHAGEEVVGTTRCLENGWYIIAEVPKAAIESVLWQSLQHMYLLGIFAFVFMTLLSLIPASAILRPIRRIHESAEKMSEGNFDVVAPQDNRDEIGGLGMMFNKMAQHLKESDELKRDFISIVSHQLRTPLTSIRLYTNLLETSIKRKSKEQKEFIKAANESIDRMSALINDLLNLSRMESGKLVFDLAPQNIASLTQEVIQSVEALRTQQQAKIELHNNVGDLEVVLDAQIVRQAIHNLLTNALKYSPDYFATIEVGINKIRSEEQEWIRISVQDHGIGIAEEERAKVFEKFARTNAAQTFSTEGNGMGLHLSKKLLETGGGKLWYTSEENKGSTFYVDVPIEGMHNAQDSKKHV